VSLQTTIPSPTVRAAIGMVLFALAWMLGAMSMRGGFEFGADLLSAGVFAVACGLWWIAYKFSRSATGRGLIVGFICLALWMLYLLGHFIIDFHETSTHLFFYLCSVMLLILITMIARSDKSPADPSTPSTFE
jgi:hypothetical protein